MGRGCGQRRCRARWCVQRRYGWGVVVGVKGAVGEGKDRVGAAELVDG